jgi:hypothetical protein
LRDCEKNLRGSGIDWPSLQIGPALRVSPVTRIYVRATYFSIRNAWRHVSENCGRAFKRRLDETMAGLDKRFANVQP